MAGGKKFKMRMKGGGNAPYSATGGAESCPPGQFCLTSNMVFFALALVLVGLLIYVIMTNQQTFRAALGSLQQQQQQDDTPMQFVNNMLPLGNRPPAPPTILNIHAGGGDSRYDRAPQPLRDWNAGPEWPPRGGIASIPINIPTQGLPERFQSVGIMTTPDGKVLPLYGRRTATSTDRWNYYTRTDTYNPVPIPVSYKKRDCMDDVGCEELMDGEEVKNFGTGVDGKVHIYRMDGPKYIPGLI